MFLQVVIPQNPEMKDILFEQIIHIHTGKTISYMYYGHSFEYVSVTRGFSSHAQKRQVGMILGSTFNSIC